MTNLTELLENNAVPTDVKVNVYLKLIDSEVLIDAPFQTIDFDGGLKEFATVVNRITKPFKDATKNKCYLAINWTERGEDAANFTMTDEIIEKTVDFIFLAGKFAPKLTTVIDAIAQSNRIFGTDKVKFKALKAQVIEYFDANISGFINTLEFIDFIEHTPLDALYIATKKANITLIDATNEAK